MGSYCIETKGALKAVPSLGPNASLFFRRVLGRKSHVLTAGKGLHSDLPHASERDFCFLVPSRGELNFCAPDTPIVMDIHLKYGGSKWSLSDPKFRLESTVF